MELRTGDGEACGGHLGHVAEVLLELIVLEGSDEECASTVELTGLGQSDDACCLEHEAAGDAQDDSLLIDEALDAFIGYSPPASDLGARGLSVAAGCDIPVNGLLAIVAGR